MSEGAIKNAVMKRLGKEPHSVVRKLHGNPFAVAGDPDILFMDEPFSALDAPLRRRLQDELLAILEPRRTSVAFVTHDLAEALYLGDRVLVLRAGAVVRDEAVGLPRPRDPRDPCFADLADSLSLTLGEPGPIQSRGCELQFEEDSA